MNPKKLLLIRLDKIGDLICTLGVDQTPEIQSYQRLWLIQKGLGFIPQHLKEKSPRTRFKELNKSTPWITFKNLRTLLTEEKPDVAVSFQAPWWIHFALWWAQVPVRAGVHSQWHSYLFLNKGLRQKRSRSIKHESEYNQELLNFALDLHSNKTEVKGSSPIHWVQLAIQNSPAEIFDFLKNKNLKSESYVVVHPGMAGSALNWPVKKYAELILDIGLKTTVVLTGTPTDDPWIQPLLEILKSSPVFPQLQWLNLQSQLSPTELLIILKNAQWVLAPSTGVIHLAAALGTPVKAIYSPIRVHHPRRWGPQGSGKIEIFLPDVPCPEAFRCAGKKCAFFNCMDKIKFSCDC